MEVEKRKRLSDFLDKHGKTYEILPKSQLTQLIKIDDAIEERLARIKNSEETIRQQSINVLNIASETKIARKTFYNNELLRLYVEECAAECYNESIACKEKIKNLKEQIVNLESSVQRFMLRDVETENLRRELAVTQRELTSLLTAYNGLKDKYEKLLFQIEQPQARQQCKVLVPKNGEFSATAKE